MWPSRNARSSHCLKVRPLGRSSPKVPSGRGWPMNCMEPLQTSWSSVSLGTGSPDCINTWPVENMGPIFSGTGSCARILGANIIMIDKDLMNRRVVALDIMYISDPSHRNIAGASGATSSIDTSIVRDGVFRETLPVSSDLDPVRSAPAPGELYSPHWSLEPVPDRY